MDFATRTIDELLARYELEPELDDVFVEGVFDREIISNALGYSATVRAVYEIDTVDVPPALLVGHGLSDGNKQRVIALARELASLPGPCNYICLVDRDLDHWFGNLEITPGLRWTKYSSIELHFFTPEILTQILCTTCRANIARFANFLQSITVILSELYAMRLADRKLALNLRWIPFEKYLTINGGLVALAEDTYRDRLLQANSKSTFKGKFTTETIRFKNSFSGDCRNHIRGHDFVTIIAWSIRRFRGLKELSSEVAVQRLLVLLARTLPEICDEVVCA
jgi:hypothetical protein